MKIKRKTKMIIGIICLFILGFSMFTKSVVADDIVDIFVNYQSYNADVSFNYGVLIDNASDTNNYRNYLDSDLEVSDYDNYDNITEFSNDVDYSNYIYQQQYYLYNDNSFNITNGKYDASYSFENGSLYGIEGFQYINCNYKSTAYGHKDVVEFDDINEFEYASLYRYFEVNKTFGSIELWFYMVNDNNNINFTLSDGLDIGVNFYIDSNNFYYYDTSENLIDSFETNVWNHISINFECGNTGYKGLIADSFSVGINGNEYGIYDFRNEIDYVYLFNVSTSMLDGIYDAYIDAIGFSFSHGNDDYNGTFTFTNEIGLSDNDISFVDSATIGNGGSVSVIPYYDNHKSVLKVDSSSTSSRTYVKYNLDNEINNVNFSIEFWSLQTGVNRIGFL